MCLLKKNLKTAIPEFPIATSIILSNFSCLWIVSIWVTHKLVSSVVYILMSTRLFSKLCRLSSSCCCHTPAVLLLARPKHNLISVLAAPLIKSVWDHWVMPMVMLLMLLLLLLLEEFGVQASVQGTALAQLLHFLCCIFGHERINFSGSGVPGLDGRWFIFVVYYKALLNWPWSCAKSWMLCFLMVEVEADCLLLSEARKHPTEQLRRKHPSIRNEYPQRSKEAFFLFFLLISGWNQRWSDRFCRLSIRSSFK